MFSSYFSMDFVKGLNFSVDFKEEEEGVEEEEKQEIMDPMKWILLEKKEEGDEDETKVGTLSVTDHP